MQDDETARQMQAEMEAQEKKEAKIKQARMEFSNRALGGLEDAVVFYKQFLIKSRKSGSSRSLKATQVDTRHLPVAFVADSLVSLFRVDYHNSPKLLNPQSVPEIKEHLLSMLESLERQQDQNRIAPMIRDEKKVARLTEFVILGEIWPSRGEIMADEKGDLEAMDVGSLRYLASMGRTTELAATLDLFLESMKPAHFNCHKELTERGTVEAVFDKIDFDEDGEFSGEESRELFRQMLARPTLGGLMLDTVFDDPSNGLTSTDLARPKLRLLLPEIVTKFGQSCKQVSEDLWKMLDKDGNGCVEAVEFCELLPVAFKHVVLAPLTSELATRGRQFLAAQDFKEIVVEKKRINPNDLKENGMCMGCRRGNRTEEQNGCVTM